MKKQILSFLSGLVIGAILLTSTFAYAETKQLIEAVFGSVKLVINGIPILDDTLLYNGTTYVPIRAMSFYFNKDVKYNDSTKTAYINDKPSTAPYETVGTGYGSDSAQRPTVNEDYEQSRFKTYVGIMAYLAENYSLLETDIGKCEITFHVAANMDKIRPEDFQIIGMLPQDYFIELSTANNRTYSKTDYINAKAQLKKHMETVASDLIKKMPDKKFLGYYNYSYYKYEHINQDIVYYQYHTWSNFGNYSDANALYDNYTPQSSITWLTDRDSKFAY